MKHRQRTNHLATFRLPMWGLALLCLLAAWSAPARGANTQNLVISVSINPSPPAATITVPTPAQVFGTTTITLTGTAAATNGVVNMVKVSIDGGAWQNAANTGANFSTWGYATTTLALGAHSILWAVQDSFDGSATAGVAVNFSIDNTPPPAVASVSDSLGADIDTATDTTQLSANWAAAADAESGIARYWYSIGTTSGASDTVVWTNNGAAVSFTKTGLALASGTTYFVTVKAENGVGLQSANTTSDGVTIASGPPSSIITSPASGTILKKA